MTFKTGIVGFGKMGVIRADIVKAHPDLTLDAICENNDGDEELKDYKDLLKLEPDIVFVCTPPNVSCDIIADALDAGCHVFAEKPPGRNLMDLQKVIRAANRNPDCKLQFGFNHRYHPSIMLAKEVVDSGDLGKLLSVRGIYGKSGEPDYENTWRAKKDIAGGGILIDQGIHMLDIMQELCGEFTEVHAISSTLHWPMEVEDNVFVLMQSKDGIPCFLESSMIEWRHIFQLKLNLSWGYVLIKGILTHSGTYGPEKIVIARKTYKEGKIGNPDEDIQSWDEDLSFGREVNAFVKSIKEDLPVENGDLEDAISIMKLIERIYEEKP